MEVFFKRLFSLFSSYIWGMRKGISCKRTFLRHTKVRLDKGNQVFFETSYVKNSTFRVKGRYNHIKLNTTIFDSYIHINGNNNVVEIENKALINNLKLHIDGSGCYIKIGDGTKINGAHLVCSGQSNQIIIEDDCMLADMIEIWASDTHPIYMINDTVHATNYSKNIVIQRHVWIGQRACILKGVTVGENSVIGMASVVTKSIRPNTIVAGNPAREIKTGYTWGRVFNDYASS